MIDRGNFQGAKMRGLKGMAPWSVVGVEQHGRFK